MKLLAKPQAESRAKRENNDLIDSNLRLREYEKTVIGRLNTAKENYEPEKMQALQSFETFMKDIQEKKSKLFQELAGIEQAIAGKKEIYYGMITRMDELQEKAYEIKEAHKKLDLRQIFVEDLEKKWREKN